MFGFKTINSTVPTLTGIQATQMIRKGQLDQTGITTAFQLFSELAT